MASGLAVRCAVAVESPEVFGETCALEKTPQPATARAAATITRGRRDAATFAPRARPAAARPSRALPRRRSRANRSSALQLRSGVASTFAFPAARSIVGTRSACRQLRRRVLLDRRSERRFLTRLRWPVKAPTGVGEASIRSGHGRHPRPDHADRSASRPWRGAPPGSALGGPARRRPSRGDAAAISARPRPGLQRQVVGRDGAPAGRGRPELGFGGPAWARAVGQAGFGL